jgi:hypothetical protein
MLTLYSPPLPTPHWVIWRENYKYWVQTKGSSVLSVVVSWLCDGTMVLTSSSTSSSTSHLFNNPWGRVSWLLFGPSICRFSRSLGWLASLATVHAIQYRVLWRPVTTRDRRGIHSTNFSNWGRGGQDKCAVLLRHNCSPLLCLFM